MKIRWIAVSIVLAALSCVRVDSAVAASITIGTEIPITATTFALPLQITGGVQVTAWQFDLSFDPNDVQVNTNCDPFSDAFCSLSTNAVTEGSFFAGGVPFNVLIPGFLFVDPVTLQQTGVLQGVNDAYGGFPPAPSGDGVIAYVEFLRLGSGTSPITVGNTGTTSGASPVPEPATLMLLAAGAMGAGVRRCRRVL